MASANLNLDLEVVSYKPLRVKRVKEHDLAEKVLCADLLQLPFPSQFTDLQLLLCKH